MARLGTVVDRTKGGGEIRKHVYVEKKHEYHPTHGTCYYAWLPTGHARDRGVCLIRAATLTEARKALRDAGEEICSDAPKEAAA